MPKSVIVSAGILVGILSAVFFFIDKTVAFGLIVGYIFSLLYLLILTLNVKYLISEKVSFLSIAGYLLRMLILAFPLLLAGLFPNYLNMFGVFFGFLMFKICLYLLTILKKGGL